MKIFQLLIIMCFFISCTDKNSGNKIVNDGRNDIVIKANVINNSFVGNGFQWGGYDMINQWMGVSSLSDEDWKTIHQRIRFMRPPIVRIMVSPGSNYMHWDEYQPEKSAPLLFKMLDFCQQENIAVMFGEWGHIGGNDIDQNWLDNSVSFFEYLVNTKGYTCIKYFNMVNEPNGDWSSINNNYGLWTNLVTQFQAKLVEKGLNTKVQLIGPDIAIWDNRSTGWITNTKNDLGNIIGAYDIHTYPTESTVRSGAYYDIIKAYKDASDTSKPILMGELGFKYDDNSDLGKENKKRIAADKYTSDDSNMMVYESFYGVDMADALIQNMRAGYGGVILWDLDDAMYNLESQGSTKLKRWGFWNILGKEKFENPADENIRPWFYPMSLMCRYFPAGTKIYEVQLPEKSGLRAVVGEKDGKYTIAVVNSHAVSYSIKLKMDNGIVLNNANVYHYQANSGSSFDGDVDENGFAKPQTANTKVDLSVGKSYPLDMKGRSFYLITNME